MSDAITVLRAHGRRLAKTINGDGEIFPYDSVKTIDLFEIEIGELGALERLLHHLDHRPDCCVVRGGIADPKRTKGVRRLLYADADTGDEPTLREVPRRWIALDLDGLPLPALTEPGELEVCASVAIERLPEPFLPARCIVQATASHGLKPGLRLRLWYWLNRPVSGEELKYWLRNAPVDKAIFGPAQPIYTAAPVFLPGAFDPLPERFAVMAGADAVIVPPPRLLKPPPRPKPRIEIAGNDCEARAIAGVVRTVAQAANGNRNAALYWGARTLAEKVALHVIDIGTARTLLEAAALQAGMPENEAAATVRSGLRHGGA